MSEIKGDLSNLQLSSETIVFAKDSQTGELTISNLHHSYSVCWKVALPPRRSRPKSRRSSRSSRPRDSSNRARRSRLPSRPPRRSYLCSHPGRCRPGEVRERTQISAAGSQPHILRHQQRGRGHSLAADQRESGGYQSGVLRSEDIDRFLRQPQQGQGTHPQLHPLRQQTQQPVRQRNQNQQEEPRHERHRPQPEVQPGGGPRPQRG